MTRTGNNPDGCNPGQVSEVGRKPVMPFSCRSGIRKEQPVEFVASFRDHSPRSVQPVNMNMGKERSVISEAKVNCATDSSVTRIDFNIFDD